jgi:large subunit ribosomal protein L17
MRKFGKKRGRRILFVKNLAHNLIKTGKMETTVSRAKEIRPIVERLISVAKKQQLSALRRLLAYLPKQTAQKLYYEIAPKYKDRHGGYLRIIKEAKVRKRDGTQLAIIEFVS